MKSGTERIVLLSMVALFLCLSNSYAQQQQHCEGGYSACIDGINTYYNYLVSTCQEKAVIEYNKECPGANTYTTPDGILHIQVTTCNSSLQDKLSKCVFFIDYSYCEITYNQCVMTQTSTNTGTPALGSGGGGGGAATASQPADINWSDTQDCELCVGEPVNLSNGNMYLHHMDYLADGLSKELSLVRTYNSQNSYSGLFGTGWSTPFEEKLTIIDNNTVSVSSGDGSAIYFTRNGSSSTFIASKPPNEKSNVVKNSNSTYTLLLKNGEKHMFNVNGKLISIVDRNGNTTTLNYNSAGFPSTIISSVGRTLTLTYNTSNKVISISDGANVSVEAAYNPEILGVVAAYEYDSASGSLSKVTYVNGSKYQYFYTRNSGTGKYYLTTVKDALNNILEAHQYDNQGRAITSEKGSGIDKYTITYVSATETKVTDGLNRVTRTIFKNIGGKNVIDSVIGPYSNQETKPRYKTYDPFLNMIMERDQFGNQITYSYDLDGNVTKINSLLKSIELKYNGLGQILNEKDDLGNMTNTYDSKGNLTSIVDSTGATTKFTYDSRGLVITKTDPRNYVTKYAYDKFGNLLTVTDALNQVSVSYKYDIRGRVTQITDAMNNVTKMSYDVKNRVAIITYPDNTKTQILYDLADQLMKVVDPNGRSTLYTYDTAGRLITITDALGQSATRTYDVMSNLISEKDALGRVTEYTYNDMNKVSKIKYPAASSGAARLEENFIYDEVGNLTERRDTANRVTRYYHDAEGRVIATSDPGNHNIANAYDSHDNLKRVTDMSGNQYEFVYDYRDRLKTIRRAGGAKIRKYDHDLAGNVIKMTNYDGSVTQYTYDELNRLTKITNPDGTASTFTYDAASKMLTATNATGTVKFTYDNRNRVASVTDVWGFQILYNYDAAGNKTQMSVGGIVTTYQYDALNRVINQLDNGGNTAAFAYDAAGRLSTRTLNNKLIAAYAYNNLDQVTNIGYKVGANNLMNFQYAYSTTMDISQITDITGTHIYGYDAISQLTTATHSSFPKETFTYDAIGNHANSTGAISYQYDANGDLKLRKDVGTAPVNKNIAYQYDALGRLVGRISGNLQARYIYDGDDVVADMMIVNDASAVTLFYGNGPGVDNKLWFITISPVGVSAPVFYVKDHLGSTRALVSNTGSVTNLIDYDSFGKPLGTATGTRFLYTGREYDADTELYYYRARWYDPQARRFISEDPIGLNGGINLYAYVKNNPINYIDPSGLRDIEVYIWNSQVTSGSVGHVMITEYNATKDVILSQFPKKMWISSNNTLKNIQQTSDKEYGRPADKKFLIRIPDDKAFDSVVADHVGRKTWNWKPSTDDQTHCARSAYDALKAGGLPLAGQDKGQILPGTLGDLLDNLSKTSSPRNGWRVEKIYK